ncbi:TIGR01777 family oxidoreductase [Nocardioides marinquilinus]|uniref:TIGR01777 family oxidoreductase n=1 Tax=Nocardioides marinquilinus TaxID=1210400 RepID=A0ABP9PUU4_9ACTN
MAGTPPSPGLSVVVAGASGFLGTHLVAALRERGHGVTALVRREPDGPGQSRWDPDAGTLDRDLVGAADVVVNLAGSPTAGNPHSKKWARELERSRVTTTSLLAEVVAGAARGGATRTFLAGNGISYYGDHGDAVLTEASDTRGHSTLTKVARAWEAAASPAADAGARVCVLRTSPVMDHRSPPLKQLRLLFKAGLGGRIGNGRQYMPMSSLRDWVAAAVHLAEHPDASGPFNICLPHAPINAEFTRELAAQLGRKALLPAPGPLVKVGAGRMGPELLGSVNVRPEALLATGFTFADPDVAATLRTALNPPD